MTDARKWGYVKWRNQRADDSTDIVTGPSPFAEIKFYPSYGRGSRLDLANRNQNDIMHRSGIRSVYILPFMQTVTHKIDFGKSRLLVPYMPAD